MQTTLSFKTKTDKKFKESLHGNGLFSSSSLRGDYAFDKGNVSLSEILVPK